MTFKEIYDKIIPYWGDFIRFEDGQIDKTDSTYFYSKLLSEQWNKIEKEVGQINSYNST